MNHRGMVYCSFVLIVSLVFLYGCPKKAEMTSSTEPQQETIAPETQAPQAESAASTAETQPEVSNERSEMAAGGLQPVYFDFDQAFIRDDAKAIMKANAEWLKANPTANIRIEGNCDERGTIEYNQALGQRRAVRAKQYLTTLGVSENRITLISYGKEKSVCSGHDESCWQKNRKDDFVVVAD